MSRVPVKLISNPYTKRAIAFDPQRLSIAPLDPGLAERINRFATAGHGQEPLTHDEERQWDMIHDRLTGKIPADLAVAHDRITQLVLSNTYTCNMGCTYCYNELDTKPLKGSEVPGGMSWDTAKASLDSTIAQMPDGGTLNLFFVGGEPLLERDLMEQAVEYASRECSVRNLRLSINVYTNGTLITQRSLKWFREFNVSVVLSLDGPDILNRNRVYLSGRPTTHIVLKNVKRLIDSGSQQIMRVRAVSTPTTPLVPLHKYLLSLGFNEIHVQPMYDNDGISSVSEEDMVGLLHWWTDLMIEGTVIDIMPFSSYFQKLLAKRAAVGSWYPCQAGKNAMTVGPDGRVYSCHHAIEETEFQMGHIDQGLPTSTQRSEFYSDVNDREPCSSCWAKHMCGGECYHRSAAAGAGQFGTLPTVCLERRSLIGISLDAFAEIAVKNPTSLARLATGRLSPVVPVESAYQVRDLALYA